MAHERARRPPQRAPGGALIVTDAAARAVVRGHPWIFREQARKVPEAPAGDEVVVTRESGERLGRAILDPASPIVARVLARAEEHGGAKLVSARLATAIALRKALVASDATTAYRLVNGEGDRLPGLVIDRYGDVGVVRTDGHGPARWVEEHRKPICAALHAAGVRAVALRVASQGDEKIAHWDGGEVPEAVVVREHGMAMHVDLARGQKTGAFLDQRESRLRVRGLARGRTVLNLFSYAGGFSLAAALGGATRTTSVDIASGGHAAAQRSFRENGLDPHAHAFVTADAFTFLDQAKARGTKWDLVICDPPSFAPSEKAKPKALAAYRKLHAACVAVLAPGGLLCAASCSSHVTATDFAGTLDAESVGADLLLLEMHGQPLDHPSLPAWPEGRYLKFAVLAGTGHA